MWKLRRWTRFLILIGLTVLSAVAGVVFIAYRCANPPDRVIVSFNHLPEGTCFACMASESGGALRKMPWYVTVALVDTLAWDPYTHQWSYRDPHSPDSSWGGLPVRWLPGERYGVVTKNRDQTWQVTWFSPDEVKIVGGAVTMDVSKGKTVPLTKEEVGRLEFQ